MKTGFKTIIVYCLVFAILNFGSDEIDKIVDLHESSVKKQKIQQNVFVASYHMMHKNTKKNNENESINQLPKDVLQDIFRIYISIRDLVTIRDTCKTFRNLCQDSKGREYKHYTSIFLNLDELDTINAIMVGFHPEFFTVTAGQNLCAILTESGNIITFEVKEYIDIAQKLFSKARKKICLEDDKPFAPMKILNGHVQEEHALAYITKNGKVETVGCYKRGGRIPKVIQDKIENANTIFPCKGSYAVLTDSYKLYYWGTTPTGEAFDYIFSDVKEVFSKYDKLIFLSKDCTLFIYEQGKRNEIPEPIQSQLNPKKQAGKKIKKFFISTSSFICSVLMENGSLLSWNIYKPEVQLKIIQNVATLPGFKYDCFVAIHKNGNVTSWYYDRSSGQAIDLIIYTQLKEDLKTIGIKKICQSYKKEFAALLKDNTIRTWGNQPDIPFPKDQIHAKVKEIFCNDSSFVAIKENQTVFAWGSAKVGGDIPENLIEKLNHVKMIVPGTGSFCAIQEDGSAYCWGYTLVYAVHVQLQDVKMMFSFQSFYVALKNDGSVQHVYQSALDEVNEIKNVNQVLTRHDAIAFILNDDSHCSNKGSIPWVLTNSSTALHLFAKLFSSFFGTGTTLLLFQAKCFCYVFVFLVVSMLIALLWRD